MKKPHVNSKPLTSGRKVISRIKPLIKPKDPYTFGHMMRTGKYAALIAKGLGMPELEAAEVKIAGFLHDLGKCKTPDKILKATSKLTPWQIKVMKLHTRTSAIQIRRLFPITLSDHLASVGMVGINTHHERWDGKGYPRGLKGEEIPLLGRILAVADSYDAMTSQRSYNIPKTRKQAIAILRWEAGKQFDPEVVKAFIQQLDLRTPRLPDGVFSKAQ